MKCVISGQSLGVWCRVIHSLVQIGDDEVFFDFAETIMTISTTNSSMSTFSTFILFRPFFANYSMVSEHPEKVAIPAKVILKPYRSQRMAKNHVSSEIKYNLNDDHITITSEGKSHASSSYRLGASVHNEEIQFDLDPYSYRNCLKIDSKVLSSCLANFSHMKGLSELSLKIQGQRVTLKNTVTDVTRKDGSVVTEFNLTALDFIDFEVQDDDLEFAFGFREFKLYTTFAEQLKLPVNIHFQNAADPVIVTVKMDTFEARLCMATRVGDPFNNLAPTPNGTATSSNGRISNVTTQSSGTSSVSGPPQEVIRQRANANRAVATPVNNPEPPPAKRVRRTEAVPPLAELPQPAVSAQIEDAVDNDIEIIYPNIDEAQNPGDVVIGEIGRLVEKMGDPTIVAVNKFFKKLIHCPRRLETDVLDGFPGHSVVLCPESDDDDE